MSYNVLLGQTTLYEIFDLLKYVYGTPQWLCNCACIILKLTFGLYNCVSYPVTRATYFNLYSLASLDRRPFIYQKHNSSKLGSLIYVTR